MGRRPLLRDLDLDDVDLRRSARRSRAATSRRTRSTSAVDDAKSATETFTSDLDGLGKPDTEAGQQAKESIDKLSTELKAEVTKIEDAARRRIGHRGIIAAVPVIISTLGDDGDAGHLDALDLEGLDAKGELESAFEDSSSCTDLTGS